MGLRDILRDVYAENKAVDARQTAEELQCQELLRRSLLARKVVEESGRLIADDPQTIARRIPLPRAGQRRFAQVFDVPQDFFDIAALSAYITKHPCENHASWSITSKSKVNEAVTPVAEFRAFGNVGSVGIYGIVDQIDPETLLSFKEEAGFAPAPYGSESFTTIGNIAVSFLAGLDKTLQANGVPL